MLKIMETKMKKQMWLLSLLMLGFSNSVFATKANLLWFPKNVLGPLNRAYALKEFKKAEAKIKQAREEAKKAREKAGETLNIEIGMIFKIAAAAEVDQARAKAKKARKKAGETLNKALEIGMIFKIVAAAEVDQAWKKVDKAENGEEAKEEFRNIIGVWQNGEESCVTNKIINALTSGYTVAGCTIIGFGLFVIAAQKSYRALCVEKNVRPRKKGFAKYLCSLKAVKNLTKQKGWFVAGTTALTAAILVTVAGSAFLNEWSMNRYFSLAVS